MYLGYKQHLIKGIEEIYHMDNERNLIKENRLYGMKLLNELKLLINKEILILK